MTPAPSVVAKMAELAKEKTRVVVQLALTQNRGAACVSRVTEVQVARCVLAATMVLVIHRHLRPCANVTFLLLGHIALNVDVSTVGYVPTPRVAVHFTGVSAKIILTLSLVA